MNILLKAHEGLIYRTGLQHGTATKRSLAVVADAPLVDRIKLIKSEQSEEHGKI